MSENETAPPNGTPEGTSDSSSDVPLVDQSELDALLAQFSASKDAPPPAEEPPADTPEETPEPTADALEVPEEPPGQSVPADSEPASDDELPGAVSQDEIDRLLAGGAAEADEPLDDRSPESVLPPDAGDGMDTVLGGEEGAADAPLAVSQADIDALIGAGSAAPATPAAEAEEKQEDLSQDAGPEQIEDDDPIARLAKQEAEGTVGSENLAAAAETPPEEDDGLISQDMLDSLLAGAKETGADTEEEEDVGQLDDMLDAAAAAAQTESEPAPEPTEEAEPAAEAEKAPEAVVVPSEEELTEELAGMGLEEAPAAAGPPDVGEAELEVAAPKKRPRKKANALVRLAEAVGPRGPKLIAAASVGILAAVAAFTVLYSNRQRPVDLGTLPPVKMTDLQREIRAAKNLVDVGRYPEALSKIERIMEKAPAGPDRGEAAYLQVKAMYMGLPERVSALGAEDVHIAMDDFLREAPAHAKIPEVLHWKALLYERTGLPQGARDVYSEMLEAYVSDPDLDEVLLDAARVSMTVKRPQEAVDYLERFLTQFPGSARGGEARLALGEALVAAGKRAEGVALLMRIAKSQPNTKLGADAYARLGGVAFDEGAYADAIELLESRLTTATTIDGNEQVYLMLAKAYRATNQLAEAERVLRELIDFFPESSVTPEAYVELSQVLDSRGQRREALLVASQGASDSPDNAAVLRNKAELLVASGNKRAAAEALIEADQQGANDPAALLMAGRLYREMDEPIEAQAALERLITGFPRTPEAFEGSIELAKVFLDRGRVRKALNRLRNLAEMSEGKPQRLPVLVALAETYEDLGLTTQAASTYGEVAALTTEPEVLASAAITMLDAEQWSDGLAVAERVDLSRVRDATAYEFLTKHGEALLRTDSARAVAEMEQAYESYPAARTPEGNLALLRAYLATDRNARARIVIRDIQDQVRRSPGDAGLLEKAGGLWGDYLFERRDYRSAVEAYTLAAGELGSSSKDAEWARYMRANALLQLQSFDESIKQYDAIAKSKSPWAEDARIKAGYARLEQRLRGIEPTPAATEG